MVYAVQNEVCYGFYFVVLYVSINALASEKSGGLEPPPSLIQCDNDTIMPQIVGHITMPPPQLATSNIGPSISSYAKITVKTGSRPDRKLEKKLIYRSKGLNVCEMVYGLCNYDSTPISPLRTQTRQKI